MTMNRTNLNTFCLQVATSCIDLCINQLFLIRNQYETPLQTANNDAFDPLPNSMRQRFSPAEYHDDGIFLRKTGEQYGVALSRLYFDKLRSDKNYIIHLLAQLLKQLLQENGHFHSLEEELTANKTLVTEEHEFVEQYVRHLMTLDLLKTLSQYLTADTTVPKQPLQTYDACMMWNAMRLRFTRNWELARQAQQAAKCRDIERDYQQKLKATRLKIDYETRCQMESHTFQILKIDTMNETSLKWSDKFDADYEAVEIDIQVATERLEGLKVKRKEMEETFKKRRKTMDDWYEKLAKEAEFQKNIVKFSRNAFILQCWWRAIMVRKGFGPYAKGKKGK